MRCAHCKTANLDDSRFCSNCGAALMIICPRCDFPHQVEKRRCLNCGHALVTAANLAIPLIARGAAGPQPPADDAAQLNALFEGERKHLTVLFADIVGSSQLIAGIDPEDAQEFLLPPLQTMMEAVRRYGGTVTQVLGDGIMALFGAPVAQEDHAAKACLAALAMQQGMGLARAAAKNDAIAIRVGLNSGAVVVRAIDNDIHIDYRAIGETVSMAARMESCARPGSVALTAATYRLADRFVEAQPFACAAHGHAHDGVETFELTGVKQRAARRPSKVTRVLTRFVGRDTEMAVLRRARDQAAAGHGRAVAFVGEPGVGKSRLYDEFVAGERAGDWTVFHSSLVSYDLANPARPARELAGRLLGIDADDVERTVRYTVSGRLAGLDVPSDYAEPALLALLGVAPDGDAWQALDPAERHRYTIDTVVWLTAHEAAVRPVMAVFEDLQFVDSETQSLLDALIARIADAPVLLLLNYRPEFRPEWTATRVFAAHRIEPLSPDQAAEFLGESLGDDATLEPVKRMLIAHTEGVPFFLEESVRALVESETLVGERGAYRLASPTLELRVPASVRAVLAARIDRLPPADKRLLLTAAVLGRRVGVALLRDVAELSREALRAGLERLQAAEFLDRSRLFPEAELSFRHALTHEVAYNTLLRARRQALHARVVAAIEARYAGRLEDQVERLAHHAVEGAQWEKALAYCRQAANNAMSKSGNREAAEYLINALRVLRHLPQTRENKEKLIDLRLKLAETIFPLARYDEVHDHFVKARELASALRDERRLAKIASHESIILWKNGRITEALSRGKTAFKLSKGLADSELKVLSAGRLGALLLDRGDYVSACDCLTNAIENIRDDSSGERYGLLVVASVGCRACLAVGLAEIGEFSEALRVGREGIRIAADVGHPFSEVYMNVYFGHVLLRKGDVEEGLSYLESGYDICETAKTELFRPLSASSLGYALVRVGEVSRGLQLLESAIRSANEQSLQFRRALQFIWFGEALLLRGKVDDALRYTVNAVKIAEENGEKGHEGWARWLIGSIFLETEKFDQSMNAFRDAISLGASLSMRPLLADCHLGLGELFRRHGRDTEARKELIAAGALYRAMDARPRLRSAEAALAEAVVNGGSRTESTEDRLSARIARGGE